MSTGPIIPSLEQRLSPSPVCEPAALNQPGLGRPLDGATADRSLWQSHCRRAAGLIRQLGGRTDVALRRELDRFFAARPELSHADRAAIARAMSRFRNQLLHHPRSTLRTAAVAADDDPSLLDAVRRLFGLADAPHAHHAEPRIPADRPTHSSTGSVAC